MAANSKSHAVLQTSYFRANGSSCRLHDGIRHERVNWEVILILFQYFREFREPDCLHRHLWLCFCTQYYVYIGLLWAIVYLPCTMLIWFVVTNVLLLKGSLIVEINPIIEPCSGTVVSSQADFTISTFIVLRFHLILNFSTNIYVSPYQGIMWWGETHIQERLS